MGQDISLPVIISPTGVQAVDPDGEVAVARAAAARGTAMGLSLVRQQADRGGRRGQPADLLPDLLDGGRDAMRAAHASARSAAGAAGLIVTTRLVVLARPRLGQPDDPRADGPEDHGAHGAGGDHRPRWLWTFGRTGRPPDLTVPNLAAAASRRPPSSAPTASGWARRRRPGRTSPGCASSGAAPFMLKGVMRVDDAKRAVDAGRHGDLGVQPRRQQPGRHAGLDPRAARDRRRGRRPGRGAAGRRHPARQRRRQGAGPRRPRGDDRPRLPVGPGRQRPGRRRERARHPARRHRLGAAGSGRMRRSTT